MSNCYFAGILQPAKRSNAAHDGHPRTFRLYVECWYFMARFNIVGEVHSNPEGGQPQGKPYPPRYDFRRLASLDLREWEGDLMLKKNRGPI